MILDALTRDNPLLSRPTNGAEQVANGGENAPAGNHDIALLCAVDCTKSAAAKVSSYIEAGIAPATRRAYQSDLDHFRAWGYGLGAHHDHFGGDGQLAPGLRAAEPLAGFGDNVPGAVLGQGRFGAVFPGGDAGRSA